MDGNLTANFTFNEVAGQARDLGSIDSTTLNGGIVTKSGPINNNTWKICLFDAGANTADGTLLAGLTVIQTSDAAGAGHAVLFSFPMNAGLLAPGTSANVSVNFDSGSCAPRNCFTARHCYSVKGGPANGTRAYVLAQPSPASPERRRILATRRRRERLMFMRWVLVLTGMMVCAQDPRALIEKSLQRDQRDDELARQYAYLETSAEQEWSGGQRTKTKTETHEIMSLYGQPYRRLVAKDGKPLTSQEARKEQEKIDKLAAERSRETPAQTERRLAKYAEERRKQRAFLQAIPRAYTFQMAGDATVGGRAAWVIDATPNGSFQAREAREKILTKFKGRFYVAKQDATLLKLEAEAMDTVSFGLVLARLDKGARFSLEKTRVNDELWMPLKIKVDFEARLALLKKLRVDVQIDYGNFRKFQTESRILSVSTP